MSGYEQLRDWNFDGWSNQQLADEVQKLSNGALAVKFSEASDALRKLADGLRRTDEVLRTQLRALGIEWQGAAGEKANQKATVAAEGINDAGEASVENSDAMSRQGESNSSARNSSPDADTLRKDSETNLLDKGAGLFNIETDHAKEVAATNAARDQAIDSLKGYVNNSQDSLNAFRAPGQPPNFDVTSTSTATTPVHTVGPSTTGTPGIPGGPGFPGSPGTPGSPGSPGVPVSPTPNLPGGSTGVLPGQPTPNPIAAGPGLPKPFGSPIPVAAAAAAAAAAGLAGATGTARPAQVVGGGRGPSQAPKTPIAPAGPKGAPSTIGAGTPKGGSGAAPGGPGATPGKGAPGMMTPGGSAGVGPEANRPGTAAAKAGAAGAKGSGSLMSPAAGAQRGEGDEDSEHVRKYGVESDEMFGDDRMVVQSVIGEDPKDK